MPVYVIWGALDRITPLPQGERLAQLVPGAELVVIQGVGHIPQIEDAPAFNELLAKTVDKALSATARH